MNTVNFNFEVTGDLSNCLKNSNNFTNENMPSQGTTPLKLTADSNLLAKYNKPNLSQMGESHNANDIAEMRAPPNLLATTETILGQDLSVDLMNNAQSKTTMSKYNPFVHRNKRSQMRLKPLAGTKSLGKNTFFGTHKNNGPEKMDKTNKSKQSTNSAGIPDGDDVVSEPVTRSFTDEPGTENDLSEKDGDMNIASNKGVSNIQMSQSQNMNMQESDKLDKFMDASQFSNNAMNFKVKVVPVSNFNNISQIEKKIIIDDFERIVPPTFTEKRRNIVWLENIPYFEEVFSITSAYMMQRSN